MKMKFIAAGAAFCALGMTGCSNETDEPDAQTGKQVVMTMQTATDGPQTRADYTEDETDDTKMKFSWRNGDELSVVVDGVAGNENKKLTATADGKSAPFSGEVTSFEGSKTIYAFYPYSTSPYAITGGDNSATATAALTLPNPQTYTVATGTATTGAMTNSFMVGVGTATANGDAITASASLKQVMSIIKLNITNAPGKVTGVKLKCTDAVFATTATVKLSDASITNPSGLVNELSMTVTDNSIDNTATKAISFALFPKAKVDGKKIQIEVTYEGGESNTIEKDDIAFARNMHYMMSFDAKDELIKKTKWDGTYPAADANATFSGGDGKTLATPFLIASAKDFAQFAANGKDYSSGKFFRLESDIDLDQKYWTPIASFSGNFDGGQHTISQVNVNSADKTAKASGLFAQLSGTVTIANLHVRGNVNLGTVTDDTYWWYAGGICGITQVGGNATISGCSFDGTVTGGWAGGICGISKAVTTITACRNSGEIIATRNSIDCYTGGILGRHYNTKSVNIIACYNTGKVNPVALYTGGIVGNGNDYTTVTACYNTYTGALYNVGSQLTATACYAVAANGDGDGDEAWKATLFSSSWPSADANSAWTASSDADGTLNKYWKSLGNWNGGTNPEYPKLWWEK